MRGIMIAVGAALIKRFDWIIGILSVGVLASVFASHRDTAPIVSSVTGNGIERKKFPGKKSDE